MKNPVERRNVFQGSPQIVVQNIRGGRRLAKEARDRMAGLPGGVSHARANQSARTRDENGCHG